MIRLSPLASDLEAMARQHQRDLMRVKLQRPAQSGWLVIVMLACCIGFVAGLYVGAEVTWGSVRASQEQP